MADETISVKSVMDPVLAPFMQCRDSAEATRLLGELMTIHAEPVIRGVIRRKFRNARTADEFEDVASEARVLVIAQLNEIHSDRGARTIGNFASYTAAVAFHACHQRIRQKHPEWTRLRNRVRYVLEHHLSLKIWRWHDGDWLCGLYTWEGDNRKEESDQRFVRILDHPQDWTFKQQDERNDLAALVGAIFRKVGGPVELDGLVTVVAALWGIREPGDSKASASNENADPLGLLPSPGVDAETVIIQRSKLAGLWKEMCELPVRQRCALLLNLRDESGNGVIETLPYSGVAIASIRQVAAALEMPASELAALWNLLPLDDVTIAHRLGITRQQVINLRKCARERLGRRLKQELSRIVWRSSEQWNRAKLTFRHSRPILSVIKVPG
jgi:hypothetical protein